jgi:signal peptide peptidase SppA
MSYLPRLAGLIFGRPHYVTPSAAETVVQGLTQRLEIGARFLSEERKDSKPWNGYRISSPGIAVVDLQGEFVNRGAYLGADSGLISYEGVRQTMAMLAADASIHAAILDIDSPGGMASGMKEAAESVRALAAVKHVVAVADDMMCSAAYGIASGAHRIVTTEFGTVGSIGVVMIHRDVSAKLEKEGVAVTIIHAGAHKVDGNPFAPLPDAVRATYEAECARYYDAFVATVAAGRPGLSGKAIRATEARTYLGADAVTAGLADAVGTFDSVLADLERQISAGTLPRPKSRSSAAKGQTMTDKTHTQADIDAAATAARAEAKIAERTRIGAILNHPEAQGRADQANHLAFKTDMPPADAVSLLATGSKAAPVTAAATTPAVQTTAGLEHFVTPGGAPAAKKPSALTDVNAHYAKINAGSAS